MDSRKTCLVALSFLFFCALCIESSSSTGEEAAVIEADLVHYEPLVRAKRSDGGLLSIRAKRQSDQNDKSTNSSTQQPSSSNVTTPKTESTDSQTTPKSDGANVTTDSQVTQPNTNSTTLKPTNPTDSGPTNSTTKQADSNNSTISVAETTLAPQTKATDAITTTIQTTLASTPVTDSMHNETISTIVKPGPASTPLTTIPTTVTQITKPATSVLNETTTTPTTNSTKIPEATNSTILPTEQSKITTATPQANTTTPSSNTNATTPSSNTNVTTPSSNTNATTPSTNTNTTALPVTTTPNTTASPLTTTFLPIDNRKYYSLEYIRDEQDAKSLFIDISNIGTQSSQLDGHRLASQLRANWNFMFYGHDVNHFTVTTGGFLYMDRFLHQHLTATQYVAPLMGNFHTRTNASTSGVFYAISNDMFVVQWQDLELKDQPEAGLFTFQVQLHKEKGTIVFAYKKIPIRVDEIKKTSHSVKAGVADAYYYDYGIFRTIYEYHNISVNFNQVSSNTAIRFTHLTTCNTLKDCDSCHSANITDFQCYWCSDSDIQRCSDTKDRGRQQWILNLCPTTEARKETCPIPTTPSPPTTTPKTTPRPAVTTTPTTTRRTTKSTPERTTSNGTQCDPADPKCVRDIGAGSARQQSQKTDKKKTNTEAGLIVGIVLSVVVAAVIVSVILLGVYGYRNPQSAAGQFLIKYRPSELSRKWSNSRGDDYRLNSQTLNNDAYEGNW